MSLATFSFNACLVVILTVSQGQSVSLSPDGSMMAVGAMGANNASGATFIFTSAGGTWHQVITVLYKVTTDCFRTWHVS